MGTWHTTIPNASYTSSRSSRLPVTNAFSSSGRAATGGAMALTRFVPKIWQQQGSRRAPPHKVSDARWWLKVIIGVDRLRKVRAEGRGSYLLVV